MASNTLGVYDHGTKPTLFQVLRGKVVKLGSFAKQFQCRFGLNMNQIVLVWPLFAIYVYSMICMTQGPSLSSCLAPSVRHCVATTFIFKLFVLCRNQTLRPYLSCAQHASHLFGILFGQYQPLRDQQCGSRGLPWTPQDKNPNCVFSMSSTKTPNQRPCAQLGKFF